MVTATGPVPAVAGTVKVICVSLTMTKGAPTPFRVTEVVPVRYWPVTVTVVPTSPEDGENPALAGTAGTVTAQDTEGLVPSGEVTDRA